MPKQLPYMKWYPAQCDNDEVVCMMTDEEFGFYMRCLNKAWDNDGLPGDLESIARMFRRSLADVERLWLIVGKKWGLCEGRFRNGRQEKEREEAYDKSTLATISVGQRKDRRSKPDTATNVVTNVEPTNNEGKTSEVPAFYNASVSVSLSEVKEIVSLESHPDLFEDGALHPDKALAYLASQYPRAGRVRLKIARDLLMDRLWTAKQNGTPMEARFSEILAGLVRWNASEQWRRGAVNTIVNFLAEDLWEEHPLSAVEAAAVNAKSRDSPGPRLVGKAAGLRAELEASKGKELRS